MLVSLGEVAYMEQAVAVAVNGMAMVQEVQEVLGLLM